jgi:hypothetical protein
MNVHGVVANLFSRSKLNTVPQHENALKNVRNELQRERLRGHNIRISRPALQKDFEALSLEPNLYSGTPGLGRLQPRQPSIGAATHLPLTDAEVQHEHCSLELHSQLLSGPSSSKLPISVAEVLQCHVYQAYWSTGRPFQDRSGRPTVD